MDRDYELWEVNAHPYQLVFYSFYNNLRREHTEEQAQRANGQEPVKDRIIRLTDERVQEEETRTGRSVDKMRQAEIFLDVVREANSSLYNENNAPEGSFNDFLDVRRPFIEPTKGFTA